MDTNALASIFQDPNIFAFLVGVRWLTWPFLRPLLHGDGGVRGGARWYGRDDGGPRVCRASRAGAAPSPRGPARQWYVTISRGRRGIRIFTPDKEQLRENVARSRHRPLATESTELATGFVPRRGVRLWYRLHGYLLRFGQRAADTFCRLKLARRRHLQPKQKHEHKNTRMLGERPERSRGQNRSIG